MSETNGQPTALGPLYEALANAQGEFPAIERTRTVRVRMKSGGEYEFAYAPLDTILAATRPALTKYGLTVTQLLQDTQMVTKLGHKSGAELESRLPIPPSQEIQQLGSAITYLRRYSIQALLGIAAEEDDDGNAHDGNKVEVVETPVTDYKVERVGPFGLAPNQMIGALSDRELTDYIKKYTANVQSPEKAQWKAKNQRTLDALIAMNLERHPDPHEPPFSSAVGKYAEKGSQPPAVVAPAPVLSGDAKAERLALRGAITKAEKARGLTDDEKKALGPEFLGVGENVLSAPIERLYLLRDFLENAEGVERWRGERKSGSAA